MGYQRFDIQRFIGLQVKGCIHRSVKTIANADGVAAIESTARHAGVHLENFYIAIDKIEAENLPHVRHQKRTEASHQTLGLLKQWERVNLDPLKQRIAARRGEALARMSAARHRGPETDTERIVREIRQREFRDQLRGLDSTAIAAIYVGGDAFTREAIEAAPPTIAGRSGLARVTPLIDPAVVASTREDEAMTAAPEIKAELEELDAVNISYAVILNSAKKAVNDATTYLDLQAHKIANHPLDFVVSSRNWTPLKPSVVAEP